MKHSILLLVAVAGVVLIGISASAKQTAAPGAGTLVKLDVSVRDKNGPVLDLRQDEFLVLDDGKKVELTTFTKVAALGSTTGGDGRDLVLILDDTRPEWVVGRMPGATGPTESVQQVAEMFLSHSGPGDNVSVVRLRGASDDMTKDRPEALARIDGYRAGLLPDVPEETTEDLLRLVARLSNELEERAPNRRKAIVCVGWHCIPSEAISTAPRREYANWVDAVSAAARSNVVFYSARPNLDPRTNLRALALGLLTDRTGGEAVGGRSRAEFVPGVEEVYAVLSHYYMLGYTPVGSKKDLRMVSVKVSRQGATVYTRSQRGR